MALVRQPVTAEATLERSATSSVATNELYIYVELERRYIEFVGGDLQNQLMDNH